MLGEAYRVAKDLGINSIDATKSQEALPKETEMGVIVSENRQRGSFWQLLQADYGFRLHYGKPPLISSGTWTVNLPTFKDDRISSSGMGPTTFITSTRITFVMMKYFDLVKGRIEASNRSLEISLLVDEIHSVISEWGIVCLPLTATAIY